MANYVIWTVDLWVQLHYKLLKDLCLSLWRRPVLRTLDLRHNMWEEAERVTADQALLCKGKYKQYVKTAVLTLFPSSQRVTMTIIDDCCSQIILQKSLTVSSFGPTPHTQHIYTGMHSYYQHKIKCIDSVHEECDNLTLPWAAIYFLDSLYPCSRKTNYIQQIKPTACTVRKRSWTLKSKVTF